MADGLGVRRVPPFFPDPFHQKDCVVGPEGGEEHKDVDE